MNQYEAMFLFDPTFGASFEACETEIKRLMERANAELLFCRKWEERRLAYKIKGRKRGVYVLVYFKAPPDKIVPLERDVQISENILRVLVLRADYVTPEMMEMAAQKRVEGVAGDQAPGAADSSDRTSRQKKTYSVEDVKDNEDSDADESEESGEVDVISTGDGSNSSADRAARGAE
ncbi:MAG: 30S ribosomal protein S6 [Phycisphaerales bacterium]|nr:MAG: 30S ribosomal protein S6 [Phycisphaerales bacterium]